MGCIWDILPFKQYKDCNFWFKRNKKDTVGSYHIIFNIELTEDQSNTTDGGSVALNKDQTVLCILH